MALYSVAAAAAERLCGNSKYTARQRLARLLVVTSRLRSTGQPHQHIVGCSRLELGQPFVDRDGLVGVVERDVRLGLAERGGFGQVAGRLSLSERPEAISRGLGPAERQFGRAHVVDRVVCQQPSLLGRGSEQRNRGGVVLVVDKTEGSRNSHRTRARGIRGNEPHLRERTRNRWMGGWSELLRAGLCREHANRDQEGNEPCHVRAINRPAWRKGRPERRRAPPCGTP